MNQAIRTDDLIRSSGVEALTDMNLVVPEGAVYALVGPNGAGKTTAIKILMNIFRATQRARRSVGVDSTRLAGQGFASIG